MQRLAGLDMRVNLSVHGGVEKREPVAFLMNDTSTVENFAQLL